MRKRSRSFHTKSKEEFEELIKKDEEDETDNDNNSIKRKRSKISLLIEDDDGLSANPIIQQEDNLGVCNTFTLIENTLKEEDEESILINSLENINLSYRKKDKTLFLESVSNFYLSSKDRIKLDLTTACSYQSENRISRSFSLDSLNIIDFDESYPIMLDPLLSQNIKLTDEVIKIILIGDQSVGKSLLIEKLINTGKVDKFIHTNSLEIKKKRIKLLDRILTLEFWDTNREILSSKLSQSIYLLILAYYKLCDGFILLYDPLDIDSIIFVQKQLEILIQKTHLQNILLIANIRFADDKDTNRIREIKKLFTVLIY